MFKRFRNVSIKAHATIVVAGVTLLAIMVGSAAIVATFGMMDSIASTRSAAKNVELFYRGVIDVQMFDRRIVRMTLREAGEPADPAQIQAVASGLTSTFQFLDGLDLPGSPELPLLRDHLRKHIQVGTELAENPPADPQERLRRIDAYADSAGRLSQLAR